jgi:hypothetical protein
MQELRVLGRVLAVVVALAWAMMGAGSRASLAPWVMPALVAGVTVSNVHNGNVMPVAISERENAARRLRARSVSFRGGIKYSTRGILPVPGFVALTTADQVST